MSITRKGSESGCYYCGTERSCERCDGPSEVEAMLNAISAPKHDPRVEAYFADVAKKVSEAVKSCGCPVSFGPAGHMPSCYNRAVQARRASGVPPEIAPSPALSPSPIPHTAEQPNPGVPPQETGPVIGECVVCKKAITYDWYLVSTKLGDKASGMCCSQRCVQSVSA